MGLELLNKMVEISLFDRGLSIFGDFILHCVLVYIWMCSVYYV